MPALPEKGPGRARGKTSPAASAVQAFGSGSARERLYYINNYQPSGMRLVGVRVCRSASRVFILYCARVGEKRDDFEKKNAFSYINIQNVCYLCIYIYICIYVFFFNIKRWENRE